jgi:hypothetical protein
MNDCCTRERKKTDYLLLPKAMLIAVGVLTISLFLEIQLANLIGG